MSKHNRERRAARREQTANIKKPLVPVTTYSDYARLRVGKKGRRRLRGK